jgi:uncharacterized membrane protein
MLYNLFKWLHILAAIVALGANITYGFWLSRAAQSPEALLFTLNTVKALDRRIANPAYGVSLLTGLILVTLGHWPLTASWIDIALILYFSVFLLGFFVYAPAFRRQIQLAETPGPRSPEYAAAARRGTILGVLVTLIVVVIVLFMVTKPQLW